MQKTTQVLVCAKSCFTRHVLRVSFIHVHVFVICNYLTRSNCCTTQCDVGYVNVHFVGTSGVTYIRWGRKTCEGNGVTLLYSGKSLRGKKKQGQSPETVKCLMVHCVTHQI